MSRPMLTIIVSIFLGIVVGTLLIIAPLQPPMASYILHVSHTVALAVLFVAMGILCWLLFHEWRFTRFEATQKNSMGTAFLELKKGFETIFDDSTSGIAQLSLDGRVTKANHAFADLLGYSESDLLTMNFYQLIHPNDLNNLQTNVPLLIDKKLKTYQSEQLCYRKNNETLWIMSTLSLMFNSKDKPDHYILQIQNITQQKKAEERLHHMAYHDALTGVANRNKLDQFVSHILASSRRHQQEFALLFLDLDRFKNINDTIGHEAGDMLLQIIAERLMSTVRNTDLVARLGGDEFILVITDVKKTEAVALIAQKILETAMEAIVVKGQEIYITTSIGIGIYPHDGQNIQSLMKNADLALYRAKEHGRNNYQFYTSEMTSKTQEKMALQNALGHALAKNEFSLNYQPKMNIKTRRITGIEAFLRWKNKEYTSITPDEIISLAEETGLIIPVSDWVLKTACQQLNEWHTMGFTSLTMAVNCSPRQFKHATFVDDVLRTMTQFNLPPKSLELEITEQIIMEDPENTLRVLYALKDIGVLIVIDDFGTGYWSLNNLRRLSVDKIKIDKSFIKQVRVDETSAIITSAIIAMANTLGITVIAEGVETREQYEFLAAEGCQEIQGYYLTQPQTEESITAFLKHPMPEGEMAADVEVIV